MVRLLDKTVANLYPANVSLRVIPQYFIYLAWAAWLLAFTGMISRFVKGDK
jgi:hypothetical protein